jgi:LmbE family N-acetylglucosaminyl deacetylase
MRVLALAPHPDDELLGCGAAHLALAAAGHDVRVLPVTLGRRADRERRREELERACRVAGLTLVTGAEPLAMSAGEHDDLHAAAARLAAELPEHLEGVDLVTAPSPRDVHPAHEAVAGALAGAVEAAGADRRIWLWSIWGALPRPTLWFPFEEPLLDHLIAAVAEHRSQVVRSDLPRLLRGRAEAASVLGPELLYGFGIEAPAAPFAELLCEAAFRDGVWFAGRARQLDVADPLGGEDAVEPRVLAGSWVR